MAFGASEAARWQAYQTRARMGAHLWFQIFTWVLLGWIGLTIYVVWYETGAYSPALQHAYFWRWVICGIISRTPLLDYFAPRLYVPAAGHWYPLPALHRLAERTATLSSAVHHLVLSLRGADRPTPARAGRRRSSPGAHAMSSIANTSAASACCAPKQHNRQLNGGWMARLGRSATGIGLGASIISANKECEHFLITGSPGAGKSTLIRHMLSQIERRGQSADRDRSRLRIRSGIL